MAGLQCVCGDVFMASCDIESSSYTFAWILLMLSLAMECDDDSESDDEANPMYT